MGDFNSFCVFIHEFFAFLTSFSRISPKSHDLLATKLLLLRSLLMLVLLLASLMLLASLPFQVSILLLTSVISLLSLLLPSRLLLMFYSSCEFLLLLQAYLLNVAGFSTAAIYDVNGVHVVVGQAPPPPAR